MSALMNVAAFGFRHDKLTLACGKGDKVQDLMVKIANQFEKLNFVPIQVDKLEIRDGYRLLPDAIVSETLQDFGEAKAFIKRLQPLRCFTYRLLTSIVYSVEHFRSKVI